MYELKLCVFVISNENKKFGESLLVRERIDESIKLKDGKEEGV